ncbi:hypothetical protein O2V63_11430 [Modestobacter sp. VKM Ac-2977]|uniref:hypothetical protein n=1 Tax=Modestobacter sp. VKM Ac-2977 TaxID=3004131 RepID=UPI0022AA9DD1|nr:hypothetical protein [Modestobacter sp. VKM Ac-2977]MCZ2820942.1 hypothetical protein [Modestobacter sp. VKM Ac-2977]
MNHQDDGRLDALLRSAAAEDPGNDEQLFAEAWSRVQTAMRAGTSTGDDLQQRRLALIGDRQVAARRRRRATRLATAALVVAVAGGGTAAAAEFLSTRTGEELTGWEVGAGGSGEMLDRGGADLRQVVEEVTADIAFAPGYEAQRGLALDFHGRAEPGAAITESHLRSSIAGAAVCTWADAWVAADDTGDAAARAATAEVLADAVSWEPFLTFAEDHGEPRPADSAPDRSTSYRWWLRPLAEAADSGDRQAVLDTVAESHACSYDVLPVIDADPGYRYHGVR